MRLAQVGHQDRGSPRTRARPAPPPASCRAGARAPPRSPASASEVRGAAHHLDQRHAVDRVEEVEAAEALGVREPLGERVDRERRGVGGEHARRAACAPRARANTRRLTSRSSTTASIAKSARLHAGQLERGQDARHLRVALARRHRAALAAALVDQRAHGLQRACQRCRLRCRARAPRSRCGSPARRCRRPSRPRRPAPRAGPSRRDRRPPPATPSWRARRAGRCAPGSCTPAR